MILGTIQNPHKLAPGELITRDGVYDLSMERYHGQPCVKPSGSTTTFKTFWFKSAAHYFDTSDLNPQKRNDDKDRPHFSLGRAAHHLIFLGRQGFDREFVVRPEKWKDYRSNDAKEWKAAQLRAKLTIITEAELEAIAGMARSLGKHSLVRNGILDGAVERSMVFRCPITGLYYKSRPDNITLSDGDFSDLKTCESVRAEDLQRSIKKFGYFMQGGLTAMAAERCLGVELKSFTLVCVEKTPPYCVETVEIPKEDIDRGRAAVEAMMIQFAHCVETGIWPGPNGDGEDARVIGLQQRDRDQIDDRLHLLRQTNPFNPHPLAAE